MPDFVDFACLELCSSNICFKTFYIQYNTFYFSHFAIYKYDTYVGVRGFEPPTSSSRTTRANRAALHPELNLEFKFIL